MYNDIYYISQYLRDINFTEDEINQLYTIIYDSIEQSKDVESQIAYTGNLKFINAYYQLLGSFSVDWYNLVKFSGLGGGGDLIKSLNPVFYIKDLTVVSGGYFIDSSGNNKQIQAATTTVANDSLIMPANDTDIITALTAAGCYSQYYTDNATPKKVLLANVSPCYNDYSYYNYFDKKNFTLFATQKTTKRDKILALNDMYILRLSSVQAATAVQVSIGLTCPINKLQYIDFGNWGNQSIQKVVSDSTPKTLSSVGYLANNNYQIQIFTKASDIAITRLSILNQPSISADIKVVDLPISVLNLTLQQLPLFKMEGLVSELPSGILILSLYEMPLIKLTGNITDLPKNMTTIDMTTLVKMYLNGLIENIPATLNGALILRFIANSVITYGGGALPAWGSVSIIIQTGLITAILDSFIINWAPVAGIGTKTVNLAGNNQPCTTSNPTVAASIVTLQGKGKTIITN